MRMPHDLIKPYVIAGVERSGDPDCMERNFRTFNGAIEAVALWQLGATRPPRFDRKPATPRSHPLNV